MTRALVFGGAGQDGTYLIEHLIEDGWTVCATQRHPIRLGARAGDGVWQWLWVDVTNQGDVGKAVHDTRPDVVFNLAAVTTPGASWQEDFGGKLANVAEVNALGALNVAWAVEHFAPGARLVHASSSAVYDPHRYGLYGASKVFAHEVIRGYRIRGLWASNAVLYSHTSTRQDGAFLVPTLCRTVARIAARDADARLTVRAPDARRDWLHARDAVRALVAIAGAARPDDFDVASGAQVTVRGVAEHACSLGGVPWAAQPGGPITFGDEPPTVERPADLGPLRALGWSPRLSLGYAMAEMIEQAAVDLMREKRIP